jgi:small subunit ribosomal protein S8
MTDPITDMLNRIRNASAVSHETVSIPFSNIKYKIAKILEEQKLIQELEKKGRKTKKVFEIILKYDNVEKHGKIEKIPCISGLKRISKPGQRIYKRSNEIRKVQDGYGIAIISTPKGLMTNKEAKKKKLGGEIVCEIW